MDLRTLRKADGFTLIEIMIVVAIIAIMSGVAIYAINDSRPHRELRDATSTINLMIQETRFRAIRSGRPYKLCIFPDNVGLPADLQGNPDRGRAIMVGCRAGHSCAGAPGVDLPVCAADANLINDALVCDTPAECDPASAFGGDWGVVGPLEGGPTVDMELSNAVSGIRNVAFDEFLDNTSDTHSDGPFMWIELAFSGQGTVDAANSCASDGATCQSLAAGGPNVVSGGLRVSHTRLGRTKGVMWTAGGATDVRECNATTGVCDL